MSGSNNLLQSSCMFQLCTTQDVQLVQQYLKGHKNRDDSSISVEARKWDKLHIMNVVNKEIVKS